MDLHADLKRKKMKKDSITLMKSPICCLLYSSLGSSWPLREEKHRIRYDTVVSFSISSRVVEAGSDLIFKITAAYKKPACTTDKC